MTSLKLTVRAQAARDLSRYADWLREQADAATAERYLAAAWSTFEEIAGSPGLGAAAEARSVQLEHAYKWRVQGFPHQLVFYARRADDGVSTLRVLHAAQDWKRP